jgi:hypothetical protein
MEACAGGMPSGSVDSSSKSALSSWISGSGSSFFDYATCQEIKSWCTGSSTYAIDSWAQMSMEAALVAESSVEAAGGMMAFFNREIKGAYGGGACACQIIDARKRGELSGWLAGAAAWGLDGGIKGSLNMCAKGGYAAALSGAAQGALESWLKGSSCELSSDLKPSVGGWLEGGAGGSAGGKHPSHLLLKFKFLPVGYKY